MSDIPHHYEIVGGTWDTDVGFNTTLTNVIGDGCLEFKNAPVSSAGMWYDELFEVQEGNPYSLYALAYSTGTTYSIALSILWYDSTESYLSSSNTYNAPLSTASTWLRIGGMVNAPSGARFCRPYVYKVYPSSSWTFYIDALEMAAMPIGFSGKMSSAQTVTTGSGVVKITINSEEYDYGSNYDHTASNYDFTAPSTGLYSINASLFVYKLTAPSSGMRWQSWLYINGASDREIMAESDLTYVASGNFYWLQTWAATLLLTAGDVVDLRFFSGDSGTLYLAPQSRFAIHRVE